MAMCDPERWSNGRNGMNHIYFLLPSSFPICPSILSSSDLLNCGRWKSRDSTAKSEAIGTKNLLRGWRGNGEKHGVVGGGMEKGHTWKWRMGQSILSVFLSLFNEIDFRSNWGNIIFREDTSETDHHRSMADHRESMFLPWSKGLEQTIYLLMCWSRDLCFQRSLHAFDRKELWDRREGTIARN